MRRRPYRLDPANSSQFSDEPDQTTKRRSARQQAGEHSRFRGLETGKRAGPGWGTEGALGDFMVVLECGE